MNTPLPAFFVSHGSPMIALEPGDAGAFMQRLGPAIDAAFGRPKAIVSVSAHTAARVPVVLGRARATRRSTTSATSTAGSTRCATTRPAIRRSASRHRPRCCAPPASPAQQVDEGGLDHGAWTALRYIYPDADIPILPLAFVPSDPPAKQFALGAALAPLADEGVLVLGSGSITHNLRRVFAAAACVADKTGREIPESAAFRRWFAERAAARDWDALFAYRAQAPHAVDMHPTDEHLLPWYVAAGAGGREQPPRRIHDSADHGQPRHGRLCVRPERAAARRGARPGRSYMSSRGSQSPIAGT